MNAFRIGPEQNGWAVAGTRHRWLASVRIAPLASTCPDGPMSHYLTHLTRPLSRYKPQFREKAEDLFNRVKERVGETRAIALTGSYSFRVHLRGVTIPRTLAKLVIRQPTPVIQGLDTSGVYVLLRADGTLDGWLEHEPWNRARPHLTLQIMSVLFYYFRLSDRDALDAIASAIAAVILNEPPSVKGQEDPSQLQPGSSD